MINMKTVQEISNEYKNRQKAPTYSQINIRDVFGDKYIFDNVSNLKNFTDGDGCWLEFDSKHKSVNRHIRIIGYVTKYIESIPEESIPEKSVPEESVPDCVYVDIYTGSGITDHIEDVQNLNIFPDARIIQYDQTVDGKKIHIKMSGEVVKYVQRCL